MTNAFGAPAPSTPDTDAAAKVSDSARGWHGIQLGVLGFIGFCGVLRMGDESAGPEWLSWMAAMATVGAFVTALWSILKVGKVAWPVGDTPAHPRWSSAQLRTGIRATIASVAMMAVAGLTAWWPATPAPSVELQFGNGATACGVVTDGAPPRMLWLSTDSGVTLPVPVDQIVTMRPVSSCA
ncbi:hypothetical protein Cs7R123_64710 [Catellatospora sp. TT07R-123]|uniref:hypothetical protein n=1 Tax=Catellatospora sp. TT07R-123 TaxID=2733863 RepID=UPI001B0D1CDB|nr:hypothetical protein [Catellatospora sp. TT07R-123]GHJ49129.1 hypothetical protein Cs7R123_64710 [Catellatospora sp. TT07R-123]